METTNKEKTTWQTFIYSPNNPYIVWLIVQIKPLSTCSIPDSTIFYKSVHSILCLSLIHIHPSPGNYFLSLQRRSPPADQKH